MAQIDSEIYFRNKGIDLGKVMDSYQEGVKLKDIANQREKQKSIDEAYKSGVVQNPDGTYTQDRALTLSGLNKSDPRAAMEQQSKWKTSDYEDLTRKRDEIGKFTGFVANVRDQVYKDPSSYPTVINQAKSMGYDVSMMPPQYGPDAQKMIETFYSNAIGAQKQIDNQFNQQQLQSRAEDRKDAKEERRYLFGVGRQDKLDAKAEKLDEKTQTLATPYGMANTPDDAKQLKEAHVSKKSFDNKISQMIALREKHSGGATLNREDVERGKQLSKDALLEYKNMAKLGVLSKSDEDIINAIIPEDPLQYNSPLAAIQGQDPTLNRLKQFKNDSDTDFKNTVLTRTRAGIGKAADKSAPQEQTKVVNGKLYRKVEGGWLPAQK